MTELWQQSGWELSALFTSGQTSAEEIARSVTSRIDAAEEGVHAFLSRTGEAAVRHAKRVDKAKAAGEDLPPLAGMPLALKDVICTKGMRTTCASKILEGYKPPYDSSVWEVLRDQRMILVGKTNMDEFAMGSSTENSAFGVTRNPWDGSRVPGGSSGGSAAAVAAGMTPFALGSDTGGSIRQPAALCGIVGLKPTYGLVSRYGLIAFASSLDQIGPMTRTVRDAAWLLSVISFHDPRDSTSVCGERPDVMAGLDHGVGGLRVGVVRELMGEGIQAGVAARVRDGIQALERLGATVQEVSLPSIGYALDAYYLIAPAEASSNLARYDGMRYGLRVAGGDVVKTNMATRQSGFGAEVKRRIILGTFALSSGYYDAWYARAQKLRTLIIRDFERSYEQFDLLLSPTSPTTAFSIGERTGDPLQMYLSDVCTIPTNLAGACAISVPCGLADEDALPVGLQLMGPPLAEPTLLRAANALESELKFDSARAFS